VPTDGAAFALSEDRDRRLWVATVRGLVEVVDRAPVVRPLGTDDRRPMILAIASDSADRSLWLGPGTG